MNGKPVPAPTHQGGVDDLPISHIIQRAATSETTGKFTQFGLCAKCRNMCLRVHRIGATDVPVAVCGVHEWGPAPRYLSPEKPVVDCTAYWPVGAMTLYEMERMAKILEGRTQRDGLYL